MSREQYMPLSHSADQPVSPITPFSMSNKRDVHNFISDERRDGTGYSVDGEHEMNSYSNTQKVPQSQSKLINHDEKGFGERGARTGMRGTRTTIALSVFLLLLPLILSAVLVYPIYGNLESVGEDEPRRLSITEKGQQRPLANDEYYVNYSATQLVFISSLSSTLALALVPIAMALFSFTTASTWHNTYADNSNLPTPFQFKISLQLIQGGMLDFYSYVKYLCSRKRSTVAGIVHKAGITLGLMLVLALAITLVDALLHIDMDTVAYNRDARVDNINFLPGRNFPTNCWNGTDLSGFPYNLTSPDFRNAACNIDRGGSGAASKFTNTTEAYKVMANASTKHFIQLADDTLTSVITTPKSPDGVSFTAQSFGSSSKCEMVTSRCDIFYEYGGCTACQRQSFSCTPEKSGILLNGTTQDEGLTLSQGPGIFSFNWYNTSAKDINATETASDRSLMAGINGKFYSAFPFALSAMDEANFTSKVANGSLRYDPNLQLFASTYGTLYGVLSCNTTMWDVVYNSTVNGSVHVLAATVMNDTATAPFFQTLPMGKELMMSGLNLAALSAKDDKDLAYQFGRVLDRTILGMTSGALLPKEAARMFQQTSKLVAKVPKAEFTALIVLNCIMPVMGLVLGIYDFMLIKQKGVAHLQARLGLGGVVAALFEDQRLNADATSVGELYAEKRGMPTSRIAIQASGPGQIMFAALSEK